MECCFGFNSIRSPQPLMQFLRYVSTSEVSDAYTEDLDREVRRVNSSDRFREKIMTLKWIIDDAVYNENLRTTERVTKEVTKEVTNDMIFRMFDKNLDPVTICEIANVTEDELQDLSEQYEGRNKTES